MNGEGITDLKFEGYINQIGNSVNSIFMYSDSLENIDFGENSGLTKIQRGAFVTCPSLTGIVIPNSVEEIEDGAFYALGLQEGSVFCSQAQIENGICSKEKFNGIEPWPYEITEDGTYYYNPDGQLVRAVDKNGHEIDISESSSSEETSSSEQTASSEPSHIVRRIYTVEEATEAVSGKGKNTFSIRYR